MIATETNTSLLSDSIKEQIDRWLQKYPPDQKRSAVLYALRIVQEQNHGWLTTDLMNAVAEYLDIPNIAVYEVATFYSMYDLKPVGKVKVKVCTSISCMLRGSDKLVAHLRDRLGVGLGETTRDGLFTLKGVECLAACGSAPVIQIDDRHYIENITPEKIDVELNRIQEREKSHDQ
jgi:NADH-quinone oxidoreductase subunit E